MNSTYIWRKMNGNAFLTNDEREPVNMEQGVRGYRAESCREEGRFPDVGRQEEKNGISVSR